MNQTASAPPTPAPASRTKSDRSRLIQLDFLRGIAILLVLGVHMPLDWRGAGAFKPLAAFLVRFGWAGVDLFFVLSGFLVGGLLIGELVTTNRLDVKRFIVRRVFKIWPSFYIFLIAFVVYTAFQSGDFKGSFLAVLPNFFHYQNYVQQPVAHTWSLAVEEHFYLALPLLILSLLAATSAARTIRLLPFFMWGVILTCTALRVILLWHRPFYTLTHVEPTHLRMDSLCFGVFLAYIYHARKTQWDALAKYRRGIALASLLFLLPMMLLTRQHSDFAATIGYTCLYFGFGGLLVVIVQAKPGERLLGRFLSTRPARAIAWVGTFSYPIYLWHGLFGVEPVRHLLARGWIPGGGSLRWFLAACLFLALAVGTGVVAGTLVERPALLLRERLFPGRVKAMDLTPPQRPA